jgi:protein SCO1
LRTRHALARIAVALALVAALGELAGCGGSGHPAASSPGASASRYDGVAVHGLAAPNFTLHDQHGQLVSLARERGWYVLITFLYVHCRNVCPIIAGQVNEALRELGPARNEVRVLAVSVDPKGDTPAAVRHFIAVHRLLPQFLYLTGTAKALEPIWREYHVASTGTGATLAVSHTAIELLLDPQGTPRLIYDSRITAADLVHGLQTLGLKT